MLLNLKLHIRPGAAFNTNSHLKDNLNVDICAFAQKNDALSL